jgi:hypothetical protein
MTNKQSFELPYPDSTLNPNKKVHWAVLAKKKRKAREYAFYICKTKITINAVKPPIYVHYDIYPPDKRRRDGDNAKAACKAYQDGIADALGVDDYHFITSDQFHKHLPIKDGKVLVTLEWQVK